MIENTSLRFETIFLNKNPPDDERINELLCWAKKLHKSGLAPDSAGNLSFRTGRGFVITGTGTDFGAIKKEELVEVLRIAMEEGQFLVYAEGRVLPSWETLLHSEIYGLRTEINAVFHIHDQMVLEFADELKVPCTGREWPAGSYELAEEVNKLLNLRKDINYFVLKDHGVIAMGETLEEVGRHVERRHETALKNKTASNSLPQND